YGLQPARADAAALGTLAHHAHCAGEFTPLSGGIAGSPGGAASRAGGGRSGSAELSGAVRTFYAGEWPPPLADPHPLPDPLDIGVVFECDHLRAADDRQSAYPGVEARSAGGRSRAARLNSPGTHPL